MLNSPNRFFSIEGLVFVLAILLGFVGVFVVFILFQTGFFLYYLFAVGFAIFVSITILIGLKRRRIIYFTVAFALIGIVIFLSSTIVLISNSRLETVRNDLAFDMTQYFYSEEGAVVDNGTRLIPRIISLSPYSGKAFNYYYYPSLPENESIVQIDIAASDRLEFSIARTKVYVNPNAPPTDIYFNYTVEGFSKFPESPYWVTLYWTPVGSGLEMNRSVEMNRPVFFFRNPSGQEIQFSFRVTGFNLKHVDNLQIETYRPLLESYGIYFGLFSISLVVVLDVFSYRSARWSTRRSRVRPDG